MTTGAPQQHSFWSMKRLMLMALVGFCICLVGFSFWIIPSAGTLAPQQEPSTITSPEIASKTTLNPDSGSFTKGHEDRSVFYRLKAAYLHKDERIEFDIVAACNVRVTAYADGGSSFDSILEPPFFVKATADGGAIAQVVPSACRKETTENGRVPVDLLPGAIWFQDANDMGLGVGYFTEAAFENQASELKFEGATISAATAEDWQKFQPTLQKTLVPTARYFRGGLPPEVAEETVLAEPWNKQNLVAWYGKGVWGCRGYLRFAFDKPSDRKTVARLWPEGHPEYWSLNPDGIQHLLGQLRHFEVAGLTIDDYFKYDNGSRGFPTKLQGGLIGEKLSPAEMYPIRQDDGIPWLTSSINNKNVYRIDLLLAERNRGLSHCYTAVQPGSLLVKNGIVKDFAAKRYELFAGETAVQVDGSLTFGRNSRPFFIFERDEAVFIQFHF